MALSEKAKKRLEVAMGHRAQAKEIADHAEASGAAVASVANANADATYGQPEADLINELKAQVNALLVSLRAAGLLKT